MRKTKELTKQIETVLRDFQRGRDDDAWLTLKIWAMFYSKKIKVDNVGNKYVYLEDILTLPREDHVKRIRAHFQNDLNMYPPTTWLVARQRKMNETHWKQLVSGEYKRI